MEPKVLAQTAEFWALDKPAGWLCVPGRHPSAPVLIDWVRQNLGQAWVCHRLDLGTSGVWLVAKTPEAHREACQWFESHRARKQYLFLAHGLPGLPVMRLDAPIENQKAITQIEVRERFSSRNGFLGLARPQSGRRHQIRIHLSQAGHPIWGDERYGSHYVANAVSISRTALHAAVLEVPGGLRFESPLPADFNSWLEDARRGNS